MKEISTSGVAFRIIGSLAAVMTIVLPVWAQQPAQTPATQAPPAPTTPAQTMPMQGAPGQSGMMGGQRATPGMGQTPTASGPAAQAMMQSMQKMQQNMMSAPLTGNADLDFVAMMIPHHQGAIDMARTELQYGKDPTLRRMARNIIAAQEKEIREMQTWQAKHPASR